MNTYKPPVSNLLQIGGGMFDFFARKPLPDYASEYGLKEEHVPELIRMMTDSELLSIETDDAPYYAPIHALLALGQLKAQSAADPILQLFHEADHHELIWEYFPRVISQLGPVNIPKLKMYLDTEGRSERIYAHAVACLYTLANDYPDHAAECIAILSERLTHYETNGYELNADLVGVLARLKVEDTLPLIEQAYGADSVDSFIISLEDVHYMFGLRDEPDDGLSLKNMFGIQLNKSKQQHRADPKKKKKRKAAQKSRRKNRKK